MPQSPSPIEVYAIGIPLVGSHHHTRHTLFAEISRALLFVTYFEPTRME